MGVGQFLGPALRLGRMKRQSLVSDEAVLDDMGVGRFLGPALQHGCLRQQSLVSVEAVFLNILTISKLYCHLLWFDTLFLETSRGPH